MKEDFATPVDEQDKFWGMGGVLFTETSLIPSPLESSGRSWAGWRPVDIHEGEAKPFLQILSYALHGN